MELILLHACMIGPMPLVAWLSTLLQPGGLPAYRVRYRLFRMTGVGRWRSALWSIRTNGA